MGDYVEGRVGDRLYRVYGLEQLEDAIRDAAAQLRTLIEDRLDAANAALADWRGPHAPTFAERANHEVLTPMVDLRWRLLQAAERCREFPDEPYMSVYAYGEEQLSAQVEAVDHDTQAEAGAVTDTLRAFQSAGTANDWQLWSLASEATVEGLTAEAAPRLTPSELEERGYPDSVLESELVWADFEPVPVTEAFDLPDLTPDASSLRTASEDLGIWVDAVASAIDDADGGRLDLLASHPEMAGWLDDAVQTEGVMTGEAALDVMSGHFDTLDTAAGNDERDGTTSVDDLQAVVEDQGYPEELRAAAEYLLDNPILLSQLSIVNEPVAYEARPEADSFTEDDIATFLELNSAMRTIALDFDRVDTARQDDDGEDSDPDGYVSHNDLATVAEGEDYPQELRDAAQFLLDNPLLAQRLMYYEDANADRDVGAVPDRELSTDVTEAGFNYEGLVGLAVDQQAFASDPATAHELVSGLPVADRDGNGGLSIRLTSDEGVQALANAALVDVQGSLVDQHEVISHLPETTSGTRNQLITGFYNLLATRSEALFAGDLAGLPEEAGHPGANWATFGQWASYGAGRGITGDFTVFGITTSGAQQAAANGNQAIFANIGGQYAAFIEMYERNPRPTVEELEMFFGDIFDDGDGTLREGFMAYVSAMDETDPVARQQLMYQANVLIGLHEQAVVHPYLEDLAPTGSLDSFLTNYLSLQIGVDDLQLGDDVPNRSNTNNHIVSTPFPYLEVGDLTAHDLSGERVRFQEGGDRQTDAVHLAELEGIEAFQPDFSQSLAEIYESGSGGLSDPDSIEGSDASNWVNWDERMLFIARLFEQYHTDPDVFDPIQVIPADLGGIDWLDEDARPGG